jgi:transcriptional regulator with XRE-family HTH domain
MIFSPTKLATVRKVQGLIQREADARCGLAMGTVCRLESGRSTPHQATIEHLAHGLGVAPDDLMESPAMTLNPSQQVAVLRALATAEATIETLLTSRTLPDGLWESRRIEAMRPWAKAQVELDRMRVPMAGGCRAVEG